MLERLVPATGQVLIMRRLPSLVERILPSSYILPWLNCLQPTANVSLRPC